jgi:uncharacterized protein YkwD
MVTSVLTLCAGIALMADPVAPVAKTDKPVESATAPMAKAEETKTVTEKAPAAKKEESQGPQIHMVNRPIVQETSFKLFPVEEEVIKKTNEERARYGLPPLTLDPKLVQTARKHTWWMTRNRNLQHGNYPVAENIAMGQQSSSEVVRCWMNSSGHRANILNRGHRRIGVAAYTTPNGTVYWCQQFTQ